MKGILFNFLREYTFRYKTKSKDTFLSDFYPFIDNPICPSPQQDFLNLSNDWLNVSRDLNKSIQECKQENNLIPA